MPTRRRLLQTGLAVAFSGPMLFAQTPKKHAPPRLAVQTWTFRKFDLDEGIRKTREAGIDEVEIAGGITWAGKPKRASELNAEEKKRLRAVLDENRVRAVSLGGCKGTVEQFEFAKEMGLQFLQGEPPFDTLVEVSKLAEKYGIRFAIHNHRKPSSHWDYREILKRLDDCSPAMGFCPDTGHQIKSGLDPLQAIRDLKGRLVSVHLKDHDKLNPDGDPKVNLVDVSWGTGVGQAEAILKELVKQGFTGPVIVEYDKAGDNFAETKECAEFFRKIIGKPM